MAQIHIPHEIEVRYLDRPGILLPGLMFVIGLAAFIVGLSVDAHMAWVSYVSNWLWSTSIAMGAVMFTAGTTIVKARWNWSVKRISVAFAAFLPFAFLFLLPMLSLRENYFPWISQMAHEVALQKKQAYLNIPFLVTRNVVGALVLFGLGLYFAYLSVRPDMGLTSEEASADDRRSRWRERLMGGWAGQEAEEVRSWHRLNTLAPALALVYAVIMSMFAFDWAMSLEPEWNSTIFGAWFFMGAWWGGIAVTAFTVALLARKPLWRNWLGLQQRHDLGKLSFAFTVFWGYLFWSQYIVIWYGKLPWEQAWIIHRSHGPYGWLSLATLFLCFIIPFAGLLGRKPKMKPALLMTFTGSILLGLWFERFLLLAPSVHHAGEMVFPWWQPLVALMFLGPFIGSVRWFLSTFPVMQVWQPPVPEEMIEIEQELLPGVGHKETPTGRRGW